MEFLSSLGSFLLSAIAFVLLFSILIVIHELGHFLTARWGKVKVEEFGFGLPPKIFSKKTSRQVEFQKNDGKMGKEKETMEWTLNLIPFGGFVRLYGESLEKECKGDPRAFCNRPLLWRMIITIGGVTMNFLLAITLLILVSWLGYYPILDPNLSSSSGFQKYFSDGHLDEWREKGFLEKRENGVFIFAIQQDSPAEIAGFSAGDQILSVNGTLVDSPEQFIAVQKTVPLEDKMRYEVSHFSEKEKIFTDEEKTLVRKKLENGDGEMGVILIPEYYFFLNPVHYPLREAIPQGLVDSKRYIFMTLGMVQSIFRSTFGRVFEGEAPKIPEGVGGPIAIAAATHRFVQLGDFSKITQFAALLSLSLGVINVIPFPALDGARFFFQIFEGLSFFIFYPIRKIFPKLRKMPDRIPPNWETPVHFVGYILLLLFIVAVTYNDIVQFFFS
ncbi:site-2 protease family protein [Candidatus Peregrinibacteria bacterium]|nr:site-2 protease family protein [Candidatus Peregrinibacteria bacterium]